ncbi:MAG: MFS transporter, partial [Clostridia bacterium]|nr:MFS transporter [Clostridia bacterium]
IGCGKCERLCPVNNISMAVIGNFPPLLFLTFRSLYGISYSLLGLLVLVNFFTQLTVDLIFSFFSHKFNIPKTVKLTPVLTLAGLLIYALWPFLFPDAVYTGLVLGTVVFSASGGLSEVLISPVIAALPAKDPDREMSRLHSVYAWGVVLTVAVSTLFFLLVGAEHWQWLVLLYMIAPLAAFLLFCGAKIPAMETPEKVSGVLQMLKRPLLWLFVAGIFLGGAAECTMAQWCSSYLEQAVGLPKIWGDIFGVALFAVMLGMGRTLYGAIGKNITRVLFLGAIGATLCYLIAALSPIPVVGLLACAFTGFCVSMLWPGSLIASTDRIPDGGVFIYAMMASGGDLGASVGPQLVGLITDAAMEIPAAAELAQNLALTPEQLGMKLGMLVGMLFPLLGIPVYAAMIRGAKNAKKTETQ